MPAVWVASYGIETYGLTYDDYDNTLCLASPRCLGRYLLYGAWRGGADRLGIYARQSVDAGGAGSGHQPGAGGPGDLRQRFFRGADQPA